MSNHKTFLAVLCMIVGVVGCQSTPKEPEVSVDDAIQGLACELVAKALESNRLNGDKRPVLKLGPIQNDTMSIRSDGFELVKSRIAEMFSNSGRVLVLSDEKFMGQGPLPVPTHILDGRIVQRATRVNDGGKQVVYTLQLSISDVASGMRVWDGQRSVGLAVDKDKPTW